MQRRRARDRNRAAARTPAADRHADAAEPQSVLVPLALAVRAVRRRVAPTAPALVEAPPLPPPLPPLKLVGIAEDPAPTGRSRTAIISATASCSSVKEGETVTRAIASRRISADVVELIDLDDNTLRRLALRDQLTLQSSSDSSKLDF